MSASSTSFPVTPLAVKHFDHNSQQPQWTSETRFPCRATTSPAALATPYRNTAEATNLATPLPNRNGNILRFVTFNVLADSFPAVVELAIKSKLRYEHLPNALADLRGHVYGLNEVTANAMNAIRGNDYFRNAGYSTIFYDDLADKNDLRHSHYEPLSSKESKMLRQHGCALLIKNDLEVVDAFRIHLSAAAAPVAAILRIPPKTEELRQARDKSNQDTLIGVVALHTSAYAAEANRIARKNQIEGAKKVVEEMLAKARSRLELDELPEFEKDKKDVVVIMGDLNLHDINEEKTLLDANLIDCFGESHYALDPAGSAIDYVVDPKNNYFNTVKFCKRIGLDTAFAAIPRHVVNNNNTTVINRDTEEFAVFKRIFQAHQMFEYGCTFNAAQNPMIPHYIPGENRQMRLDRITIRPGCKAYLSRQTTVFGQQILPCTGQNVTLSDHYGLYADIVILDDDLLDGSKLQATDIPRLLGNGVVNAQPLVGNEVDQNDVNTARRLVGDPLVRKVREHLAKLPKDMTGRWQGVGDYFVKGLSFIAHPFFLLGRAVDLI